MVMETERLYLRRLTKEDYNDLCEILQDEKAMYAYEHAFCEEEVLLWLNKQLNRYEELGFGLWAIIDKKSGTFLGQSGLTFQQYNEKQVLEIGYLLKRKYWHNGYATEAAIECKKYAFAFLKYDEVYSIIRDNNIASQNVAKKVGMKKCDEMIKHYYNMDMPHYIYSIRNENSNL